METTTIFLTTRHPVQVALPYFCKAEDENRRVFIRLFSDKNRLSQERFVLFNNGNKSYSDHLKIDDNEVGDAEMIEKDEYESELANFKHLL